MLGFSAIWQPCPCQVCASSGKGVITGWARPFPTQPLHFLADMHQAFEIGVLLEGREEKCSGGHAFSAHVGDAWLIPGCEVHAWRPAAPRTVELTLHFLPEVLGDESFEGRSWMQMFACPPEARPRPSNEAERKEVLVAAQMLTDDLRGRQPALSEGLRIGLLRLLLVLYRMWRSRQGGVATGEPRAGRLARVMPAVNLAYSGGSHRVTLSEAATVCGLTQSHFDQVFRDIMGIPFARFEVRRRLVTASRLLIDRDLPVEAIARRTGFSDASHLHRRFLEVYGCTPGQYRAKAKGADQKPS
jgi:AraC-like DNA-binding protein